MFDAGKDCFTTRAIRRLGYWICETFFHIELTGVGHIPDKGPLIIAANHQTFIDPVFIMLPVYHKTYYMTWHKVFSIPLLAALIRWFGAFPVNIDRSDKQAFRRSLDILRAGDMLIVFPEGGRGKGGALEPFKPGMARLALASGAPILPVTIQGGEKVWPPKQRLPRTGKIRVHYHPVIRAEAAPGLNQTEARARRLRLTEQVREVIQSGMKKQISD